MKEPHFVNYMLWDSLTIVATVQPEGHAELARHGLAHAERTPQGNGYHSGPGVSRCFICGSTDVASHFESYAVCARHQEFLREAPNIYKKADYF